MHQSIKSLYQGCVRPFLLYNPSSCFLDLLCFLSVCRRFIKLVSNDTDADRFIFAEFASFEEINVDSPKQQFFGQTCAWIFYVATFFGQFMGENIELIWLFWTYYFSTSKNKMAKISNIFFAICVHCVFGTAPLTRYIL